MYKSKLFVFSAIILFLFCGVSSSFAQLGAKNNPEDIAMLKKRVLLVGIAKEDPKLIAKYKKKKDKSKLEDYRKDIKEYNENIKAAVDKFWTFNAKVEYKSHQEIASLRKAKKLSKYAILEHDIVTQYVGQFNTFRTKVGEKSVLGIMLGKGKKSKYVTSAIMPNIIASKEDFAYAILYIQNSLENFKEGKKGKEMRQEIKSNSEQLSKLTLLIDKEQLSKKTTEAKIRSVYPYKFEIVSRDRINEAIWNREEGVCYIQVIPLMAASAGGRTGGLTISKMLFGQQAMLASTGEMLAYSYPKVGFVVSKSRQEIDTKTITDLFKMSVKAIEEKIENGETVEVETN
ncbi:hypothetical protein ACE193_03380 [Bernardetia sp. OM2101]|uniref:hypothetical protein n=1 Tax=Bernardetia sp. OM2101 TaxID=3344876 RepID=UPI0035D0ECBE